MQSSEAMDEDAVFADAATALTTTQRWQQALQRELRQPALGPETGSELLALMASGEVDRGAAAVRRLRVIAGGDR